LRLLVADEPAQGALEVGEPRITLRLRRAAARLNHPALDDDAAAGKPRIDHNLAGIGIRVTHDDEEQTERARAQARPRRARMTTGRHYTGRG